MINVMETRISWSFADAARATGISVRTLHRAVKAGTLRGRKVGGRVLILDSDLQQFIGGQLPDKDADQQSVSAAKVDELAAVRQMSVSVPSELLQQTL